MYVISPTSLVVSSCSGVTAALKPLPFSINFPLRESWDPVFSIELVPAFGSVFPAFLPTVSFPLVVSTSGVSFFSTGLVFNLMLAVVTSLLYAFVISSWVLAFLNVAFAASKSAFNNATDSSVLLAYVPSASFASISAIYFSSFVVSSATFSSALAATAAATSSLVVSFATGLAVAAGAFWAFPLPAFVVLSDVVLSDTSSLAWATAPAPKKILAPITTDAAPTLNFLIEYVSTLVPSLVFFKYSLFFPTNVFSS